MSLAEMIEELPKLKPEELDELSQRIEEIEVSQARTSPELLAAIDEGLASLENEGEIPIAEARKIVASWTTK
jgi:hypothetical protein